MALLKYPIHNIHKHIHKCEFIFYQKNYSVMHFHNNIFYTLKRWIFFKKKYAKQNRSCVIFI